MKLTGLEWKRYLASWPDAWRLDDCDVTFDGKEPEDDDPADTALVEVTVGTILHDQDSGISYKNTSDLIEHLQTWLKRGKVAAFVVEVPKENTPALLALVAAMEGQVITGETGTVPALDADGVRAAAQHLVTAALAAGLHVSIDRRRTPDTGPGTSVIDVWEKRHRGAEAVAA